MIEAAVFTMAFGKYQGRPLADVPRGYLHWLLANATNLHTDTRETITAFLKQPLPPSPRGVLPGTRPRRARRAAGTKDSAAPATCARCGGSGSAERPLVHVECVSEDVPF